MVETLENIERSIRDLKEQLKSPLPNVREACLEVVQFHELKKTDDWINETSNRITDRTWYNVVSRGPRSGIESPDWDKDAGAWKTCNECLERHNPASPCP
tara:strand:- start:20504 stop:20803 length:300 start_codon:yes stop_codon:yes gene_type:complete